MAKCEFMVKNGKKWEETYTTCEPERVYERLACALVRKYIWKAPSVGRITDQPEYSTGERIITVYWKNLGKEAKEIYRVKI